ncbi:MAG: TetR/AcrR family transcriptional regulator [Parvularculaceae bacterium]|nr:TetR/AcrR family transcriptional regulator [Parvularculaceae bacterium]
MSAQAEKQTDNRDLVIERATELFWRKGFDDVSVDDLVKATGLNRYQLYQTFGGKRDIFMTILHNYIEDSQTSVGAILAETDVCPYDALYLCIEHKMLDPEIFPAGCLMCTTAVDVAAKDEEVAEIFNQVTDHMHEMFADAFRRGQAAGMVPKGRDPDAFAELSHALYFSTGVQARMGRTRESLAEAVRKTIDSVKP